MPLMEGTSKKVISQNIAEIMRSFNRTGKIGTNKPKNTEDALKMAQAIAFGKARQRNGTKSSTIVSSRIKKISKRITRSKRNGKNNHSKKKGTSKK